MYSDLRESLHRIQSLSWPKLKQIIRIRPSSGIVDMMMQYILHDSQQKQHNQTNNFFRVANMATLGAPNPLLSQVSTEADQNITTRIHTDNAARVPYIDAWGWGMWSWWNTHQIYGIMGSNVNLKVSNSDLQIHVY